MRAPSRARDEGGAVALLVGVLTVIFFTIAAMVVDLGQARVTQRAAQAASDASALAAANALYLAGTATPDIDAAVAAAKSYAADNYQVTDEDWASCTDPDALPYHVPGDTSCISFDEQAQPTQVRVVAPTRRVQTPFANVVGVSHVDVGALAQATLTQGGKSDCGLCIVGGGDHELQNGDATISGGNVALNGNVLVKPNGLVSTDGKILVEGTADGPSDGSGYDPAPLPNQPKIDDPLASVPMPTYSGLTVKTDPCGTGSDHGPGIYGDFGFPNANCVLEPGTYVITGKWSLTGSSGLDGSAGVTLYFVCGTPSAPRACNAPGEDGGWLDAAGNGLITIDAPDDGANKGWGIVYDRLNTQSLFLSGNGGSTYHGTIYALSGLLDYRGNGCGTVSTALIDVGGMEFSGTNSCLASDYVLEDNVYVPPQDPHLTK
ncbi:MAG TPA: pilus assembly protein TadG-related protein [Nocardioidaceae bacterium]|nr:pilus assembly protein TadG-related protein [Nocardioidaceae bacterium]